MPRHAFRFPSAFRRGEPDDQAIRRPPVNPVATRANQIEVIPSVGPLELFQESGHFVCLVVVKFCVTGRHKASPDLAAGRAPTGQSTLTHRAPCRGNPAAAVVHAVAGVMPRQDAGAQPQDGAAGDGGPARRCARRCTRQVALEIANGHGFHAPFFRLGMRNIRTRQREQPALHGWRNIRRGNCLDLPTVPPGLRRNVFRSEGLQRRQRAGMDRLIDPDSNAVTRNGALHGHALRFGRMAEAGECAFADRHELVRGCSRVRANDAIIRAAGASRQADFHPRARPVTKMQHTSSDGLLAAPRAS